MPAENIPTPSRRKLFNAVMWTCLGNVAGQILIPYTVSFVPPGSGGAGGGTVAADAVGKAVVLKNWLETHGKDDYSLVQGLKGDPTYLVVNNGGDNILEFGINAVCTHLGCVVPWKKGEGRFRCPCHGSQYDTQGKVTRGPAPRSLALAHTSLNADQQVVLTPWTETDFRTDEPAWWA